MGRKDSTIMDKILEANSSFHVKSSFHYGKSSISIFQEFFANIFKKIILGVRLGSRV